MGYARLESFNESALEKLISSELKYIYTYLEFDVLKLELLEDSGS